MCITSSHTLRCNVRCADDNCVPAAGMDRKRSYQLQPRCWNEHRWFNFSGEFQTALLNRLCKARKEVVVSLPNFLCILISRSLSNLELKYMRVFKHKRINNCITHSKARRNTMAADAGLPDIFWEKSQTMPKKAKWGKKNKLLKTMKFLLFPCVTMLSPRWSTKRIALWQIMLTAIWNSSTFSASLLLLEVLTL